MCMLKILLQNCCNLGLIHSSKTCTGRLQEVVVEEKILLCQGKPDENWKPIIATIQVNYNQVTPNTVGAKIS